MTDHLTLQRLVVRLLYDPALVADLRADPNRVVAPLGLSQTEVGWLVAVDPRAWGIDTMRRSRTLTALLEEFPATTALAFQRPDAAAILDTFFSDVAFHGAIQRRQALAPAFGEWWARAATEGLFSPGTAALATIESGIARLRRAASPEHGARETPPPGHLQLHSEVEILDVPGGSLALYAHVLEILGTDGALDRVVKTELHLESLPRLDTEVDETLLLDPTRPDGGVGALEPPLAELLRLAQESVPRVDLFQGMRALGAEPGEEEEILKGLIEDGLLWET